MLFYTLLLMWKKPLRSVTSATAPESTGPPLLTVSVLLLLLGLVRVGGNRLLPVLWQLKQS